MKGKRILICCNRILSLGGIEKSLTTLLRAFDLAHNDVTLVLYDDKGVLFKELPTQNLKIFYTSSIDATAMLKDDLRHFRIIEVAKGLWNRLLLRLDPYWYTRIKYYYRLIRRKLVFSGHFDCAISFTTDYSDMAMVCSVNADKRVAFVHADATKGKRAARVNDWLLRRMDKVYAVSEKAKELFLKVHPKCEKTADVLHNVALPEDILAKAEMPVDDWKQDDVVSLCTVGRLAAEKGQQMVPQIAAGLRAAGHRFRWYLVGDGAMRSQLEQEIASLGLEDCVLLMGSKPNPYPYMKKCDIYVQPSVTEAYCTTIVEAQILCKPIVVTDVPGVREQISHGKDGLIVNCATPEALTAEIKKLFDEPKMREAFWQALKQNLRDYTAELQKLYDYIEGRSR